MYSLSMSARPSMRRSVTLLLLLLSILTLLYNLPTSSISRILPVQPPATAAQSPKDILEEHYQSTPSYEYISLYRKHAPKSLEQKLDDQLRRLERSARKSLPRFKDNPHSDVASKTIWQLHTPAQGKDYSKWIEQWRAINPDWNHNALLLPYEKIFLHFTGIPQIVWIYEEYEAVRGDLLRWLVLWFWGGLAVEVDTWDRIGLDECGPLLKLLKQGNEKKREDIGLVVGVETDEPFLDNTGLKEFRIERPFGFGTAIIWAPRRFDPFLRRAIVRTISHGRAQMDPTIQGLKGRSNRTEDFIEELSGKHMFTDVILEVLTETLPPNHKLRDRNAGLRARMTWKHFSKLEEAVWIDENEAIRDKKGHKKGEMQGLGVLPINVWGNGQNHSHAGDLEGIGACVNHATGLKPPS